MPRMQDSGATKRIICACCGDTVGEWAAVSITNIIQGTGLDLDVCTECLDIMSVLLDTDLREEPEGLFQVTPFGKIEQYKQDNN